MANLRELLVDGATVVIAICAIALVGAAVYDRVAEKPNNPPPKQIGNWREYSAEGHRIGPTNAAATIVVFGDYECPACRAFESTLSAVKRAHPAGLAVIYRHWPLSQHRLAYSAARAAECAASQGRFIEYHQRLYDHPGFLGAAWQILASYAGVPDSLEFSSCVAETGPVDSIERDIAAVKALGSLGTPTVLVNDLLLFSVPDSTEVMELIRRAR